MSWSSKDLVFAKPKRSTKLLTSKERHKMRSIEIIPRDGSHYILVDGKEWSRHNDLKIAEQVRAELNARRKRDQSRRE